MNSVQLIGRLTKDPEVRYTSGSQMAVASFTIAIDRPTRQDGGEKQTDFPRITVFGRQAENCEKYLRKGLRVAIEGRIQTGSYQNRNGDTVYTTDVVANRVEFIDWADRQNNGGSGYNGGNGGYNGGNAGGGYNGGGRGPANDAPQTQAGGSADPGQGGGSNDKPSGMPDSFEAIDEDVPF